MLIDDKLIDYLEDLSCITLSNEERQRISGDLEKIIGYMDCLGGLDTEGVPECSHPFDHVNVFRDDRVGPSFDRESILLNAPETVEGMFAAPDLGVRI